jgi:phosphoribosylaminoimidazolecarboxamide formyltransferase/IMP cyclohydrolase
MKPTALISVFNKHGILEFARELEALGWDLISSGGTAKHLLAGGVKTRDVAELVGGNAILGHRVVTLSREIHAGLLARHIPEDEAEMAKLGLPYIELVCVDMYPLEFEIATPCATRDSVIEKTDVGGPTMLSSGAKGRRIVICDPADRMRVINWLKEGKPNEDEFITQLCAKADGVVANYRLASARYHSQGAIDGMIGTRVAVCKYGENAWQTPAGLYSTGSTDPLAPARFELVQGVLPSYINWTDVERMLQTMTHVVAAFDVNRGRVPQVAIGVKHGNPCGTDWETNKERALECMIVGDTRAIFGGFVMVNFAIDDKLAELLLTHSTANGQRRLLDGIVAPKFTPEAVAMLKRKGDKCRLLQNPVLINLSRKSLDKGTRFRYVRQGFLAQPNYTFVLELEKLTKYGDCTREQENDALLAWAIGSTSNSNTITLVKNGMLIGNGVGQQDRVGAAKLALQRACDAGHNVRGAVAYSDSFFPFPDGPTVLAEAGIKVILASSGSINDQKTIDVCAKHDVKLLMIPDAEGRGFFGH